MVSSRNGPGDILPGTCIGRYRIERELGRGGASVVYLATDQHLGKQWAVKVMEKAENDSDGKARSRADAESRKLIEEVELMKRLDHPSLPRIVDILEDKENLFLIMDYIEGESLASLLKRAGPFGEDVVCDWMYRLAVVLDYLHKQDPPVIYRDMKPANVIRKQDGTLILLDLGIAREYKQGRKQDTTALGTRGYAPPEQYGNAQTDIRSDIYSLGMTAAELLTGCPPDQDPYLFKAHPFRKLHPEISEKFDKILNRCLAFSPKDRYGSCRELMRDLRKIMAGDKTPSRRKDRRVSGADRRPGKKPEKKRIRKDNKKADRYTDRKAEHRTLLHAAEGTVRKTRLLVLAALIVLEIAAAVWHSEKKQPVVQAGVIPEAGQENLQELRDYLEPCRRTGLLTEEQSMELQKLYAALPEETAAGDKAEICFEIGQLYLYFYNGDQGSFRSRVLRAQPFFEKTLEQLSEVQEGDKENLSEKRVGNYVRLCTFFSLYMFDRDGISEPGSGDCEKILEAVQICLEETEPAAVGDGVWLELNLLQSMESLLREYRQNFAAAGVSEEALLTVLQTVEKKTEAVPAQRERLREMQEDILRECEDCRKELDRTYTVTRRWKEAGTVYDEEKAA